MDKRTFTLIELILASTIFLVLCTAMVSVCFAAMDLSVVSRENSEPTYVKRQLKRQFEKDFRHLVVGNSQIISPLIGQSNPFAEFREDQISFTTNSYVIKSDHPWSNFQLVEYFPEIIEDKMVLIRSVRNNLLQSTDTDSEEKIILDNLKSFKICYDVEGYELNDYDSEVEDSLPDLILIEIVWEEREREHALNLLFPLYYDEQHSVTTLSDGGGVL